LIADPAKLEKLSKKEQQLQKLMGDTFSLMVEHEKKGAN